MKNKIYMMFALNIKEVSTIMAYLKVKGFASKDDLSHLSYLGLPIHSILPKIYNKPNYWVGFNTLEKRLTAFCDLPRFARLKENFEKKIMYEKAKQDLADETFKLFKCKFIADKLAIFLKKFKRI